ncbi:MAG TPA: glycoside hydrolase family 38 C-terminal domain-containing protein, partial [Ktedonobacteraceae bacterium]|nr:glycoside hydrolase family 38 C-terminal domain-containing protein [Ktedonobacteraceae bacterium]
PHDSVCGSSIDQVHREMIPRYDQCEQIAEQLVQDALQALVQHVDIQGIIPTTASSAGDFLLPLVVFNPVETQPVALAEISLEVHTPPESLQLVNEQGEVVPHILQASEGIVALDQVVDGALLSTFLPMLEEGKVANFFVVNIVFDDTFRDEQGYLRLWATVTETQPEQRLYTRAVIERIHAALALPDAPLWRVIAAEPPNISLRFLAHDLPAFGGRAYLLRSRESGETTTPTSDITTTDTTIENAWLRIEANPADGTLTLTEKSSGKRYPGLHRFQDGGDVGDLYNWTPPSSDLIITAPAEAPTVELLNADALQATLRVTLHLSLPANCTEDRQARSGEMADCLIVTDITLLAGSRRVQLHTTITNTVRDHRLRVLFPTSVVTDTADADGTFMVNRRPVHLEVPPDGWHDWIEDPVDTHPQKRFVSVSDEQHGLALLNCGLPEYEVLPAEQEQGVIIALTLLRCIGWLSRGDITNRRGPAGPVIPTPDAQMEGTWSFDYALYPYAGPWSANAAGIRQQAHAFNTDVFIIPTGLHIGRLGTDWSFVRLEPADLVLSAIKRSEDGNGLILRWYNPLDVEVMADITTALDFVQADGVSLNEEIHSPLPGESDTPTRHWRVTTPAGTIQTLCLSRPNPSQALANN